MAEMSLWDKTQQLFFLKRRPQLHIPLEWRKPASTSEFEDQLYYEGFIARTKWGQDDLSTLPRISQDLSDLEEHLLPAFFEFNQKARHYQNRFYLYQWIFMVGALLTTAFGIFTTYAYAKDVSGMAPEVLGIATGIVSAITTFVSVRNTHGSPQQRWAKTRRLAEELRMMYFKYLAQIEPFNTTERVQRLREQVLKIRRKENENV